VAGWPLGAYLSKRLIPVVLETGLVLPTPLSGSMTPDPPTRQPGQERLSNGPDKASYGRQSLW